MAKQIKTPNSRNERETFFNIRLPLRKPFAAAPFAILLILFCKLPISSSPPSTDLRSLAAQKVPWPAFCS